MRDAASAMVRKCRSVGIVSPVAWRECRRSEHVCRLVGAGPRRRDAGKDASDASVSARRLIQIGRPRVEAGMPGEHDDLIAIRRLFVHVVVPLQRWWGSTHVGAIRPLNLTFILDPWLGWFAFWRHGSPSKQCARLLRIRDSIGQLAIHWPGAIDERHEAPCYCQGAAQQAQIAPNFSRPSSTPKNGAVIPGAHLQGSPPGAHSGSRESAKP